MPDAPRRRFDALVIGAGAAGLSATRTLSQQGKTVLLVEARQRLGGRIHTLHQPNLPLPIELGAEFIHGEAADTFEIVKAAGLGVDQLPDGHLRSRDGKLYVAPNFWDKLEQVGTEVARNAKKTRRGDRAFADALGRVGASAEVRQLLLDFVEGYHAADPHKISAAFLAANGGDELEDAGNRQFRIVTGSDGLVRWFHSGFDPERVELRTGTVATRIRWKRGEVTLWCRNGAGADLVPFRGRTAIIALPHAVLKARSLSFEPELPDKLAALDRLETGQVFKILFHFRTSFWEEDGFVRERLQEKRESGGPDLNFVHAHEVEVPTWWTALPARAPLLTGWAGGPKAEVLLRENPTTRVDRSLGSLARAFAVPRPRLDDLLAGWWHHDWQADPWSRGAYTYPLVGGIPAQRSLARPVDGTLFFAGEATDDEQTATVAGAIASGRRAARQVVRVLS